MIAYDYIVMPRALRPPIVLMGIPLLSLMPVMLIT